MRSSWLTLCASLVLAFPLAAAEIEPPNLAPTILALRDGDFTQAAKLAQAAAAVHSTPETLELLATAQLKLRQVKAAQTTIALLAHGQPESLAVPVLSGKLALLQGQPRDALRLFQQALTVDAENSEALAGRGRAKFLLGLDDLGVADLTGTLDQLVNASEAYLTLGQIAAQAGRWNEALDNYDHALDSVAPDPDALLARAQLYQSLKLRTLARQDLKAILDRQPDHRAAQAALQQVEQLPAISAQEATQQRDALLDQSVASLRAGKKELANDQFRQARLVCENAEPPAPDPAGNFLLRGERLASAGLVEAAKDDYRASLDFPNFSLTARFRLAQLFLAENDFEAAIAFLAALDSSDPSYPEAQLRLTRAHLAWAEKENRVEHFLAAEQAFALALAQQPTLATAGSIREALREARSKLSPADLEAMTTLALNEQIAEARKPAERGNLELSRSYFDVLIQRFPRTPRVYLARKEMLRQYGDRTTAAAADDEILAALKAPPPAVLTGSTAISAEARANRAVLQRPYASRPYVERARLLLAQSSRAQPSAKMLADARLSVLLEPNDPEAHALLGEVLVLQAEAAKAYTVGAMTERDKQILLGFKSADHALGLAPQDFHLLLWRGDLERDHGPEILQRESNAMRFYTRALRINPRSSRALLARAELAGKTKRDLEAVADYRTALVLLPGNLYVQYQLGIAQLYAGLAADAALSLDEARQNLAKPTIGSAAEILEATQLHLIALAAAGDRRFEALAVAVLAHSEWIGHAETALANLVQRFPHSPLLDRLKAMPGHPDPDMPRLFRDDGRHEELDATPTLKK